MKKHLPPYNTDNGNSPDYSTALFINGIYDSVLTEILDAQEGKGSAQNFLQPYKGQMIKMLARQMPTPENPIRLYLSTSENLSQICYTADIIGWEDKRQLIDNRRRKLIQHFEKFQPGELDLFSGTEKVGNTAVNLILIRNLKLLDTLHSTSLLIKASDGLPLKKRTRAGGWSEVFELGNLIELESVIQERYDSDLTSSIDNSFALSNTLLEERLNKASVMPDKVQVVSVGYRRNPDVIVAVQRRAKGLCERCGKNAPFLRRTDGSPYLEVHHWKPLSKGGEDTVENAAALCPNCHREVHHGRLDEELVK